MEHRTLTLRRVRLNDDRRPTSRVDEEASTIVRVAGPRSRPDAGRVIDLAGHVLLPAAAEPHAHLDKALTADRVPNPSGDLLGRHRGVAPTGRRSPSTTSPTGPSGRCACWSPTASPPCAPTSTPRPDTALGRRGPGEGPRGGRPSGRHPDRGPRQPAHHRPRRRADTARLLEAAMAAGADVVGGCPHLEADPERANEVLLEIAADHGRRSTSTWTRRSNPASWGCATWPRWPPSPASRHRVTASHCCSLGMQPLEVQREVAAAVAAAGVGVVTLPQTNLFLQARDWPVGAAPRPHRHPPPARRRRHRGGRRRQPPGPVQPRRAGRPAGDRRPAGDGRPPLPAESYHAVAPPAAPCSGCRPCPSHPGPRPSCWPSGPTACARPSPRPRRTASSSTPDGS